MATEPTIYVVVKFIGKSEPHRIVTSDKIERFEPDKPYRPVYRVLHEDKNKGNELLPAQLLYHSTLLEEVQNPKTRLKKPTYPRLSDALVILAEEDEDLKKADAENVNVDKDLMEKDDSFEKLNNTIDNQDLSSPDDEAEDNFTDTSPEVQKTNKTTKENQELNSPDAHNNFTAASAQIQEPKKTAKNSNANDKKNKVKSAYGKKKGSSNQQEDKRKQNELIKLKAKQIMLEVSSKKMLHEKQAKVETCLSSYQLNLPSSSNQDRPKEDFSKQQLQDENKNLKKLLDSKITENEDLQLSLVTANCKIEELQKELDETVQLLASFTQNTEIEINRLRREIDKLKSANEQQLANNYTSPLSSKRSSIYDFSSELMNCENDRINFSPNTSSTPLTSLVGAEQAIDNGITLPIKNYGNSSTPSKNGSTTRIRKSASVNCSGNSESKRTKEKKICEDSNNTNVHLKPNQTNDHHDSSISSPSTKSKTNIKSIVDYDSDDFLAEIKTVGKPQKHEDFTPYKAKLSNGITVKKMYLCYGYSITYDQWKEIREQPTGSRFVNKLALALYGQRELILRAVDLSRAEPRKDRKTPRKPVTPKKAAIIRKCYHHYLVYKKMVKPGTVKLFLKNKNLIKDKKTKQILKAWTTHLSTSICSTYTQEKLKATDELVHDSKEECEDLYPDSEEEIVPKEKRLKIISDSEED